MSDFLTVEDINSILLNYDKVNEAYILDATQITSNGTYYYDFVKVTRQSNSWTFEIDNTLWTGQYAVLNTDGTLSSLTHSVNDNVITVSTSGNSFKLMLYLCSFYYENITIQTPSLKWLLDDFSDITMEYPDDDWSFELKLVDFTGAGVDGVNYRIYLVGLGWHGGTTENGGKIVLEDMDAITFREMVPIINIYDDNNKAYFYVFLHGIPYTDATVTLTGDLIVGRKNTLTATRGNPFMRDCTITVHGETHNIRWSLLDDNTTFTVDLTEDTSAAPLKAVIDIPPTREIMGKTIETTLNRSYLTVSTFNDLKTELESLTGAQYIRLASGVSNITMTSNVNINHDVIIDCNNRILACNANSPYSFIVKADATFENLIARSIQPFAVQEKQSSLTLRNCTFESYNFNISVGHIVRCNIDHSSLSELDDFITLIDECTFKNTTLPNLIYHGGRLTITNSIFENMGKQHNPLIMQVDGECIVRNCSFERTYGGTSVWGISDSKFMALFELGEDASFNGQSYDDLMDNNVLDLTNVSVLTGVPKCSFNGITGTFTIEPIDSSKPNCLYCLSGIDYVFKANTQIRRLS